jgi:hypothetical protein
LTTQGEDEAKKENERIQRTIYKDEKLLCYKQKLKIVNGMFMPINCIKSKYLMGCEKVIKLISQHLQGQDFLVNLSTPLLQSSNLYPIVSIKKRKKLK